MEGQAGVLLRPGAGKRGGKETAAFPRKTWCFQSADGKMISLCAKTAQMGGVSFVKNVCISWRKRLEKFRGASGAAGSLQNFKALEWTVSEDTGFFLFPGKVWNFEMKIWIEFSESGKRRKKEPRNMLDKPPGYIYYRESREAASSGKTAVRPRRSPAWKLPDGAVE